MKIPISKILVFLCIVCSCSHSKKETFNVSNDIVLIFRNCPPEINIIRFTPNGSIRMDYDIGYVDSTTTRTSIVLQKMPYSDTLKIHTNSKVVEFTHFFNAIESATYLFYAGDSILFTYNDNVPVATILNRETTFSENNYDIFIREKVRKNRVSAFAYYRSPILIRDKLYPRKEETREQEQDHVVEEWLLEHKIIDSLQKLNIITDDYRRNKLISSINVACIQHPVFLQYPQIREMLADTVIFSSTNDSLLQFGYYRNYLQNKIHNHIKDFKPVLNNGEGSGGYSINYFARFDTISKLDFISAKVKQYFLKIELESILKNGDRTHIEEYFEKYISITGDTIYGNKLLTDNNIDFNNSDKLLLIDRNNNQTNLQEVLKKNREKVIYIDYWASWCAPCLQSMPEAKKLREEYKDKDVVFIYFAFSDQEEKWKEAEQKYEVNYLSESYFITNSKTSQLITDLNIREIPRYFLYNRKGNLVHLKAPAPNGREIREQLDKLLKE